MTKIFYRVLIYLISKVIKTDEISDKFPISIKAIIVDQSKVLCLKMKEMSDFPAEKSILKKKLKIV